MDEQKILKLFDEGYSIDYIIGYMLIDCNKNSKQYDSLHRQWLISKPKYTREDISHFVYKTIYNRHLENIKKGDKVNAK